MPTITHLTMFLAASLVLLLVPGPAVLYIVARSVSQGRRAGLVSVGSIEVGNFLQVAAAAAGLSALLLSSATAFAVVRYLGAAYLVYLGVRRLLSPDSSGQLTERGSRSLRRVFLQGILVAALNPKTALFFLAFLPQFVDPARGSVAVQILLLGSAFVALAMVSDSLYALLAGSASGWLKRRASAERLGNRAAGIVYILLGLAAALTEARR